MKDLHSSISIITATAAAVIIGNKTSAAIDLQGFQSAEIVVATGAVDGAGDFTTELQESDTTAGGDFTAVAASDLIGEFPESLVADSVVQVGYRGTKRYIRTVTTKNSGTSIAGSVVVVKGHPDLAPVA